MIEALGKIPFILAAVLIFGILIAVHELGHFVAAKLCGVLVNEFSIGMGPCIWSRTRGETQYSLRALPLGGFCAMEGEGEESDDPRALSKQGFLKKILIFAAGALMNFLTGVLIIAILFSGTQGFFVDEIAGTAPEFDASAEQQLLPGDRIYRVNGYRTFVYGDAQMYLSYAGDEADIEVVRDGQHIVLRDIVRQTCTDQQGNPYQGFGLFLGAGTVPATAGVKLQYIWYQTLDFVQTVWFSLAQLFTGGAGVQDLSGPVGIVSTITEVGENSETVRDAVSNILYFAALIAVNLAVMNLLPIPALDGGHIFFLLLDSAAMLLLKRHIPMKYEAIINTVFLGLLLLLMLLITVQDISKLFC